MRQELILAVIALLLAGCATTPDPVRLSNAVTAHSRFGAAETGRFGTPVTGRNWNCRSCYL